MQFLFSNTYKDRSIIRNGFNNNKIALIIGNENYKIERDILDFSLQDSEKIANFLKKRDFNVTSVDDIKTKAIFEKTIRTFVSKIHADSIVVFYYSGHGMSSNGNNYLLPTHADYNKDIHNTAFNIAYLLKSLNLREHKVNLIILDTCRESLLDGNYSTFVENTVYDMRNTYIAYATKYGGKAKDNGVFASALVEYAGKVGLTIEEVFKNVSKKVSDASNKKQIPVTTSAYNGYLYFSKQNLQKEIVTIYTDESNNLVVHHNKEKDFQYKYQGIAFILFIILSLYLYIMRLSRFKKLNIMTIGFTHYYIDDRIQGINWYDAKAYAEQFSIGDYTSWRLPKKNELKEIYKKDNRYKKFTFWSEDKTFHENDWVIDFNDGNDYCENKHTKYNLLLIMK